MAETIISFIDPKSGPVGASVAVSGTLSTKDGEYHIYLVSADSLPVRTGRKGKAIEVPPDVLPLRVGKATKDRVSDVFIVPPSESGEYQVILEDLAGKEISGAPFAVVPKIELSVPSGPVGTRVSVSGSNFPPGEVFLRWDGREIARAVASDERTFEVDFQVPPGVAGEHEVATSPVSTPGSFTIVPRIAIDHTSGTAGTEVKVEGTGFPAEPVKVKYDGKQIATAVGSERGEVTASFKVPSGRAGPHTVSSSPESNVEAFTLIPRLTLVEPALGTVGTPVEVCGEDFVPNERVSLRYDGSEVAMAVADEDCGIRATVEIPPSSAGEHRFSTEPASTELVYTVTPRFVLQPLSGPVGSELKAAATGFASARTVSLRYDDKEIAAVTTDERGSFETTLVVPPSVAGEHKFATEPPRTEQIFTVAPNVVIDADTGPVGTGVEVEGTGFPGGRRVSLRYDDREVATATADEFGSFRGALEVPPSILGEHKVSTEPPSVDRAFTVVSRLAIDPASGPVGQEVAAVGTGFAPGTRVSVRYEDREAAIAYTDGKGGFSVAVTIPPSTEGEHNLVTEPPSIQAAYTVVPRIAAEPLSGTVGMTVKVSGTGFPAGRIVSLRYDDREVATATADDTGSFVADMVVPPSITGEHSLTTEPFSTALVFAIVPKLALEPAAGYVGTEVTIAGTGFQPKPVGIRYDAEQVAEAAPDERGSFTVLVKIPESAAGEHRVATGLEPTIPVFVVNPKLSVYPGQGPVGTVATIIATGMPPGGVSLWFDDVEVASGITENRGTLRSNLEIGPSVSGEHCFTSRPASTREAFTVVPKLVLSPDRGIGAMTVVGTGMAGASRVVVSADATRLPTVPLNVDTDLQGSFSALITLPSNSPGRYTVSAQADGEAVSAMYTMIDTRGVPGPAGPPGPRGEQGPPGEKRKGLFESVVAEAQERVRQDEGDKG